MKKNNKAFTLIEIIGAVVILGILSIIAVSYFTKDLERFRDDYYKNIESTLVSSGREFYTDNRLYLPNRYLESSKVTLNTLESQNYLDKILDYEGNSCSKDSYVRVIKKSKEKYEYYLCLICEEDEYENRDSIYCDSAWDSKDTLTIEIGTPSVVYIYKGSTRDEIKEKVKISADIVKYNNKGEEIARVSGAGEDGIPEILPNNIDTINANKPGEYELIYEYGGITKTGKAIVYENTNPYISINKVNKIREGNATNALKEQVTEYKGQGEWAQKLVISLGKGDDDSTKYEESSTNVTRYQWKRGERWTDFCTPGSNGECTKTIEEEMNETIYFRAVDNEGNISKESGPYIFRIDNTPPTCELLLNGTLGENNWYTSNVEVKFKKAEDQTKDSKNTVSGIKRKGITLNTIGTDLTKTQTADTSNVTYYGVIEDNAENSTVCQISFKKDGTKPTCTLKADGTMSTSEYYGTNVTITFNTTKDGNDSNQQTQSKVRSYGIGSVTGNKTVVHTADNTTGVTYTGYIDDNAGNVGTCSITIKKKANFTINYNNNSGTGCTTKNVVFNSAVGSLCTPTRTGYTFAGWYKEAALTNKVETTTVFKNDFTTLYAKWTANTYTVTFNANGGSVGTASKTVTYDGTYGTLSTASRAGYAFAGWYTAASGGTKVETTTKVQITANQTLYAHWTQCTAGTYAAAGATSCSACPSGYTSAAGATAQNQCYINVPAGKYIGTANSSTQTSCAAGTSKAAHTVYYGSTSSCSQCTAGTYSTGGAGSCTTCPSGYTSAAGATAQNKCYISVPAGKYIGTANSTTQTSCAAGTSKAAHTVYYGSTSSCSQCSAGTYSTGGAGSCTACPSGYTSAAGATAQNKCYISVSAGKYIGTANSATQTSCAAGTYKAAHTVYYGSTSSCSQCSAGTYSTGDAGSCTTCPSGYTSAAGATAQNKCYINVSAGKYIATANSATQTNCAAGKYKAAHTVYYGSTSSCSTCAAGTYSTGGAGSCTTCPSGQTSDAGASSCHSTCTWAFRHDSGRSGFSTTCDVSNTASYCDSSTSGKAKKESCSSGYYGQKGVTHGGGAYSSLSACENKYGTGGCQSGNYLSIAVCTCE